MATQVKGECDVLSSTPSNERKSNFTLVLPVRRTVKRELTDASSSESARGRTFAHLSATVDVKPKRQRIARWLQDVQADVKEEETEGNGEFREVDLLRRLRARPDKTTMTGQNTAFEEKGSGTATSIKREESAEMSTEYFFDEEQQNSRTQSISMTRSIHNIDEQHDSTTFGTDMSVDEESCESEMSSCSSATQYIPEREPFRARRSLRRVGISGSSTERRTYRSKRSNSHHCDYRGCDRWFRCSSDLKTHHRTHTGEKPYTCSQSDCGKSFTQNSTLVRHARTHTGEKPYTCSEPGCDMSFRENGDLVKHRRTHTCEKPFSCPHARCGKSFTTSSHLVSHVRIHTGEKPYCCSEPGCGKSFIQNGTLVRHARTHTREKPYTCSEPGCDMSFRENGDLVKHRRTHTCEKPFSCPHARCGKSFTTSSHLVKHMRTHPGEKPYMCPQPNCTERFADRSDLARHRRLPHS